MIQLEDSSVHYSGVIVKDQVQNRLAAILIADIVGYTQRMENDGSGTVAAWMEAREKIIDPYIDSYSGRLVKLTGDGFLVEFSSVQRAVECALDMQAVLTTSILDFRMSVNLGDILDDGQDIHGEGVNIAARIESLANAGEICVSSAVFDQVKNAVAAEFEDMGEHELKNVSAPVHVYRVRPLRTQPVANVHSMEHLAQRKLAAIVVAEVAGFSSLMRADEQSTVKTWLSYCRDIIDPTIDKFSGRVVKRTGDGFIAEFASTNNAVLAANAIQNRVESVARDQSDENRMRFRMGINLGDIFYNEGDIYGNDVDIAARLEGIADIGTVLISRSVFDRVKRTSQLRFSSQGEHSLKNIPEPVETFRVVGALDHHSYISGNLDVTTPQKLQSSNPSSITVLPFTVIGDDPDQEYFSDGFTEDLITELSRFNELFVTSRNASIALKGQNMDPEKVGKQLGVAYCLEGSVRKMGNRVRITSQLTNTSTADNVWAEKYDCEIVELFDVQDSLAESIVSAVAGRIERKAQLEAKKKRPSDMYAYESLLRGLEHHRLGGVTRKDAEQAISWFDTAIEKDPDYGRAYAWRACAIANLGVWSGDDWWDDAVVAAHRGLELDENEPECHRIMGSISLHLREFDKAEFHFQKALTLNPNNAYIVGRLGELYNFLGDGETALQYQNRATILDPLLPSYCRELEAVAYYVLGNYSNTVSVVSQLLRKSQRAHAYRVAALNHLKDETATRIAVEELLVVNPDFCIRRFLETEYYRDDDIPRQIAIDLKTAGLPDTVAML